MKKPEIISLIKVNGKWVNQEELPPEMVSGIVEATIKQAARNIGFEVTKTLKEKTA